MPNLDARRDNVNAADHKRPLAHFPPDIWGDRFTNFTPQDILMMESYSKQIEPLKEDVRIMLMDKSKDPTETMSLIDAVERLGVSYHYENEINELLYQSFKAFAGKNNDYNLYDTALQFRIFRQHGYKIPCDVFNKFTDEKGKFKETLRSDIRGMVSLYEAVHLRIHDEDILHEALVFTTSFLNSITTSSKLARHALKQALHLGIPRVESRHAISFYEEDVSPNVTLLRFAKIDYNRLQLLHRQELSHILRWWNDLDFVRKLPYARNRCVECHFWGIAMYFAPQYALGREIVAKVILLITIIDDTFDAYGTFEELQHLAQAFERWDLSALEEIPTDYMKLVFEFVINTCDQFAKEMTNKGKPNLAQFTKDRVIDLVRSYFVEAKWLKASYVPTFEEFMINARITSTAPLIVASSLMGLEEISEVKPFEQIIHTSKAMRASQVIARLMNDIVSREEERALGQHVASSVECYMKEFDKSREEVVEIFNKMIEDAWKDLNEEFLTKTSDTSRDQDLSVLVLKRVLNFTRTLDSVYSVDDGYTYSANVVKDDIVEIYDHSIPI